MANQRQVPEHLIDDGSFHCCTKIGKSFLICGRKSSYFPYTCLVGPDWYCMIVTYSLLIVPSVLFIRNVAVYFGPSIIVITVLLLFTALGFFTMTACSDPGIVYVQRHFSSQHSGSSNEDDRDSNGVMLTNMEDKGVNDANNRSYDEEFRTSEEDPSIESDIENAIAMETSTILGRSHSPSNAAATSTIGPGGNVTNRISVGQSSLANRNSHNSVAGFSLLGSNHSSTAAILPQPMVECGRCQIDRPTIAYHCGYCGVCVRKLDHHCPWTGKCIGEKTIKTFYGFLWSLMGLIGFVCIVVIVAFVKGYDIF